MSNHPTEHEHKIHKKAAAHHRKAAHHFEMAAKADEIDDETVTAHHGYLSYGHQIQAIHYAERAAIEDESVDGDD